MAESLVGNAVVAVNLQATQQNVIDGTIGVQQALGVAFTPATPITNGVAVNNANRFWQSTARALGSGASESLNLYSLAGLDMGAGAGNDSFGKALTLASIVGIMIRNAATSAGNLIIGGEGSAACWTSPFNASATAVIGPIHPGGCIFLFDPSSTAFPIVNTTNDLLKILASGGAVTYDIFLLARQ